LRFLLILRLLQEMKQYLLTFFDQITFIKQKILFLRKFSHFFVCLIQINTTFE
jgi:hypothetical protein